jgi:hypothetical protein
MSLRAVLWSQQGWVHAASDGFLALGRTLAFFLWTFDVCFLRLAMVHPCSGWQRGKAPAKRTVARAKPKRAPAKKRMKQPTAPAVETVAVEVIEQPAPGVTTVTEVEETELRKVS